MKTKEHIRGDRYKMWRSLTLVLLYYGSQLKSSSKNVESIAKLQTHQGITAHLN